MSEEATRSPPYLPLQGGGRPAKRVGWGSHQRHRICGEAGAPPPPPAPPPRRPPPGPPAAPPPPPPCRGREERAAPDVYNRQRDHLGLRRHSHGAARAATRTTTAAENHHQLRR